MMRENSRKCAKNFKTKNHQLLFPFNTHPLTGTQYLISHHSLTTDLLSKRLFELCFSLLYFLLVTLYTVCNRPPPVTCSPPRNKFSELACSKGAHWTHEDSQYDNQLKGYKPDAQVNLVCDDDHHFEDEELSREKMLKCSEEGEWNGLGDSDTETPVDWDCGIRCVHKTSCSYPINVAKKEGSVRPGPDEKLHFGEKVTLECGWGLEMYTFESGVYRKVVGDAVEVTCQVDDSNPDETVGILSPNFLCVEKIQLMTHLGSDLEYVPQQNSAILVRQVVRLETIYSGLKTAVSQQFSNLTTAFLNERIFRRISKKKTLLQTNLLVIPSQLEEGGMATITSAIDEEIGKLKDTIIIRLGNGQEAKITHAERIPEGECGGFIEVNSKGTYEWDGSNQTLQCNFSDSTHAVAKSKCICNKDQGMCVLNTTGAFVNCPFQSRQTNDLDELNKEDMSSPDKAEKLKNITENLTDENIDEDGYDIGANTISDILETDTASLNEEEVQKMNENVLDVIDKFANAGDVVAYKEAVATDKYLKALDRVLLNTDAPEDQSKPINKKNMRIALRSVPRNTDKDLTVSCSSKTTEGGVHISTVGGSDDMGDDQEIFMKIPKTIGKSLPETNKFYFVVFEKSTFFTTEELFTKTKELQSKVFSAGVAGKSDIRGINPPIDFKMRTRNSSAQYKSECVYWRDTGGGVRERAIVKVTTLNSSTREVIHCQTDHLTSFAILMSSTPLDAIHETILNVITYLGCSLSIIGLILSLVGLSVFRVIRKPVATKVHIHMSAALLLANITFLVGIDETGSPAACLTCGILCHYFFLSAILWMGVEGFHLYVMIVRVFGHLSNRFLLKCAVFAWGFPSLMVAATLGWDVNNYETVEFCWLKKIPMISFFMAPVMIVILVNTYMFVRVTQEITKSQNRKTDNLPSNQHAGLSDIREKLVKVRASVSVMVLLGLAWILGPLMLIEPVPALKKPISYLFTVCNSLQGFLFFFFHCAIKTDVKERWKTYLGLEMGHSQISDLSKTYNQKNSKPLTNQKTTEFSKLGDSATSLNKSLLSFKPKNKVKPGRPGSPEDDSELAIVDF